jgi:membrane protein DedA with SNARE-associated domain
MMMTGTDRFVTQHGYLVLFFWVFAEQLGLPIPSIPILLAAGVLASTGRMSATGSILLAIVASLLADFAWYEVGRYKGIKVLKFLCRVSLEPDSCVSRTKSAFSKHARQSLVLAKFVPGLSTAATPLAGVLHMPVREFLLFDGAGSLLWAGGFVIVGYAFSKQIEVVTALLARFGGSVFVVVAIAIAVYVGGKFLNRRRFMKTLRMARIEPEELKQMMDEGQQVFVIDLRHNVEFEAEPESIVGALRLSPDELQEKHEQLPRDRDVILYCT